MAQYDKNIPFNNLPELPPKANLDTVEILKNTIIANKLLAELKGYCQTLPNPHLLTDLLFSYPYIKIKILEDNNIAKRQTAAEYLKKIEKTGLLEALKMGNETYYINLKLMNILSE